jgi:DNA-binding MarR family transcriptional regulator
LSPGVQAAWVALLRAHAGVTRELNARLLADHDLTLNDYEVLLHLAREPERRLKRVELANRLVLTPSGITRLLEGLDRAGYVERGTCDSDGRVVYAVLTDAGHDKIRSASASHVADVEAFFGNRFSDDELGELHQLLERLPSAGDDAQPDCSTD